MKYEVVVSAAALQDIEEAIEWYDRQIEGLGDRVKQSMYESLSKLEFNPHVSPKKYKEVRVKYIRFFPYGIHYMLTKNQIKIIGFFHMKRNPTKWVERLK